jgi:hypothetical protein
MTLSDLGNLGEFISAVAVVVSLLYLAVQVRQNTRMMRVSTHQALNSEWNSLNVAYGSDPEVATLLDRGSQDYSQLNRVERFRYTLLMRAIFGSHNDMFLCFSEGLISQEEWAGQSRAIATALAWPGARTWWERNAENTSEAFRQEISRILAAPKQSDEADQP